jgi:gamma-glutamyltranspeptidase/glutathione hydrolase
MSPTLLLDPQGEPVMAIGASGGSFIISGTLQALLAVVDFGMDPQKAVSNPRFHHQWQPDTLFLEPDFPRDVVDALRSRGHTIVLQDGYASVQLVNRIENGVSGGSDPRKSGWPVAVH